MRVGLLILSIPLCGHLGLLRCLETYNLNLASLLVPRPDLCLAVVSSLSQARGNNSVACSSCYPGCTVHSPDHVLRWWVPLQRPHLDFPTSILRWQIIAEMQDPTSCSLYGHVCASDDCYFQFLAHFCTHPCKKPTPVQKNTYKVECVATWNSPGILMHLLVEMALQQVPSSGHNWTTTF